jgi:hypothetical protein
MESAAKRTVLVHEHDRYRVIQRSARRAASRFKIMRTAAPNVTCDVRRDSGLRQRFAHFPGSTGCQPVVAGSPAGNIFGHAILARHHFPGLGKLPRPAGWQPALPRHWRRRAHRRTQAVLPDRTRRFRGHVLLHYRLTQSLAQIFHNLFDQSRARSRENEKILGAFSGSRENDQVL